MTAAYRAEIDAAQARLDVAIAQCPAVLLLKQAHYATCIGIATRHDNDHERRNWQHMQGLVAAVQAAAV